MLSRWPGLYETLNASCKNKAILHVLQQPARPGGAVKAFLQEGWGCFSVFGKSFLNSTVKRDPLPPRSLQDELTAKCLQRAGIR